MSGDELIVIPGEQPRTAAVVSVDPLEVHWEDTGDREILHSWPNGCRRVLRGTLAHRVLVERSRVESELDDQTGSTELVVALLREIGQPLTVNEIKERLTDPLGSYCLRKDLVERGLKGLPRRLNAHPSVVVSTEAAAMRRTTTTTPRFAFSGRLPSALSDSEPEAAGAGSRPEAPTATGIAEPDATPETPDPLAFLGGESLPTILNLRDISVEVAADRLAALDERAAASVRARLEDAGRRDLAVVLLAMPRPSKPVAALVRDWPDDAEADRQLLEGLRWVRTSAPALARTLDLLADRRTPPSADVTTFAVSALVSTPSLRSVLLRLLSKVPASALVPAVRDHELELLLRAVNAAALADRARILWAAMRVRPESVQSRVAWGQVSLDDLLALSSRSPEDALLSNAWVREQVVAPRVWEFLRSASSRADVARVLGWPAPVFSVVPAPQLATAFRRASERDPVLRDVADVLAGRAELERLRAEVAQAERAAERAFHVAEEAREAEQLARAAEERSFQRASQAEREQVAASQAELRQARIDGTRALVDVLVLGGRLDRSLTLGEGLERLRGEASRLGLSPIGVTGTVERFDMSRHELLGGERAEMVEVREPGYELLAPGGAVVLRRAVVVSGD